MSQLSFASTPRLDAGFRGGLPYDRTVVVPLRTTCLAWFSSLRRWFSRREWEVRLLGLPRIRDQAAESGLVLIQIDGLSRSQLEQAMRNNRLPFLKRLLEHESYRLHTFYSGLPSSTPAVQGELFYGVKTAVPSFSFRFHDTGEIVRMYYANPAAKVEERLTQNSTPLLAKGSAYVDNYTGGAAEPHFCAPNVGWNTVMRAANPLAWITVLAWHGASALRMVGLGLIEFPLAVIDCFRGLIDGRDIGKELMLVPGRVLVGVGLRELAAIGASLDVTRGVPIVHLNLLGYDEQAHGRGPSSAFAHWSLRGIDRAIHSIWKAARRSACRDYDIWIYADHGQTPVVPYHRLYGRTIHNVAEQVLGAESHDQKRTAPQLNSERAGRVTWLGASRLWTFLMGESDRDSARRTTILPSPSQPTAEPQTPKPQVSVAAMGPIGHVYVDQPLADLRKEELAREFIVSHHVPLVMWKNSRDDVLAMNAQGLFSLPNDGSTLLGANHPFLAEAAIDLAALVKHPDAGHLVLSGYTPDGPQITFASEHGTHAGPSPEETRAFALLPSDVRLPVSTRSYLRPLDLRLAAQRVLGRQPALTNPPSLPLSSPEHETTFSGFSQGTPTDSLRILTYNVRHCRGIDGRVSPRRIATVLAQSEAEIIALQEVDAGQPQNGGGNQAERIAHFLQIDSHVHSVWRLVQDGFGNAILCRKPLRMVHQRCLPCLTRGRFNWSRVGEPRGAIWVEIEWGSKRLQLISSHLSDSASERTAQLDLLLGPEFLGNEAMQGPMILCGDFNAAASAASYRKLTDHLRDVRSQFAKASAVPNWFAGRPFHRIDQMFVGHDLNVIASEVPTSALANIASDHLPLIVTLQHRLSTPSAGEPS